LNDVPIAASADRRADIVDATTDPSARSLGRSTGRNYELG